MGAVKFDTEKGSRNYSVKYSLNDADGVRALLRDRHRIASRRFHAGDYDASDIIIDLSSAIESAGLTDRQAESIAWVYGRDLTQTVTARIMGIAQPHVQVALDAACERIAAVYQRWNYGEITVNYDEEAAEGANVL